MKGRAWLWILALAAAPGAAAGQDLTARITGGGDGTVRMRFATRAGVEICEDGLRMFGHRMMWRSRWEDGDRCQPGPVEVELEVQNGGIRKVETLRLWEEGDPDARDLGEVEPGAAVAALMDAARNGRGGRGARDAVLPIMLADVDNAWQDVLGLAQDRDLSRETRKSALFWVGQEAAAEATRGLVDVATHGGEEQEIRDAAVFALSQRSPEESVPILMELARTAEQAKTRKSAFFWLAQLDDERVTAFFRDVLRGGRGG